MRYLVLIDSQQDLVAGYFADLLDAKRHGEGIASKHPNAEICIEGYPVSGVPTPIVPTPTWRYDREVASWVPIR